jgi:NADPH:quinone reductase-like Zn-dependent oxidoreductase
MKSYHANSGAGIAGLTLKEHDEPKPGPREVLIRMRANSLNFRELMVLRGNYPLPVKPDVVMGATNKPSRSERSSSVTIDHRACSDVLS